MDYGNAPQQPRGRVSKGSHPNLLTEPYVTVSRHTFPTLLFIPSHTSYLLTGYGHFSTPLQRLRLVHLLYPYLIACGLPFPKRSIPCLFNTAPLGGLKPLPVQRFWWGGSTILITTCYELYLPIHCFSAHYE